MDWDQWSLGIDSRKEVEEAREGNKRKRKKEEKKKKTQQRCTKIKSDGFRCKIMVNKPKKQDVIIMIRINYYITTVLHLQLVHKHLKKAFKFSTFYVAANGNTSLS